MHSRVHRWLRRAALALALGLPAAAIAELPASLHAAAANEGHVVIYAATDEAIARPLIRDFEQRYPGVRVHYEDMNSSRLYHRFLAETEAGGGPDVVWSSAMDLQVKLVNDGHAQPHRSAETAALPAWAVWKNEAFGTTLEPIAFAYNRHLLRADEVPTTHAELLRALAQQPERFRDRLATYDPAGSGLGLLLHSQDERANPVVFWKLAQAFARTGVTTEISTDAMLDRIAAGKTLLAYNLLGSYALLRAANDPAIGVVLPRDYTLVLTRVAFIARRARHPNAARLWLDYLLSPRGQQLLAQQPGFFSVREDLRDETGALQLREELGGAFRPIALGAGLMTYLDRAKRGAFLRRWHEQLYPGP